MVLQVPDSHGIVCGTTIKLLSAVSASDSTESVWPDNMYSSQCLRISQMRTVLSSEALARNLPLGLCVFFYIITLPPALGLICWDCMLLVSFASIFPWFVVGNLCYYSSRCSLISAA